MTEKTEAARRLYGTGAGAASIHQHAIESFFAPLETTLRHRNDKESLAKAAAARAQVQAFAVKRGLTADELREALTTLAEHEAHPRGEGAISARWQQNWAALRTAHGGDEGARAALDRAIKFQKTFAAEVPYLADRMGATGAASDLRVIDICAAHGSAEG